MVAAAGKGRGDYTGSMVVVVEVEEKETTALWLVELKGK